MAPNPHIRHGMVDQELAYLLQPLARRAGLIGTGTFNLGAPDDFRVPDRGLHRNPQPAVFVPTAAMVVEILSPGDETFAKFHFFAAHGVGEIMVADPDLRTIRLWRLRPDGAGYREVQRSALLAVSTTELTEAVRWP